MLHRMFAAIYSKSVIPKFWGKTDPCQPSKCHGPSHTLKLSDEA